VWAYTLLGQPHSGTLAEYVRVPAAMVGRVPEGVSMAAASTVGVGSLTAAFGLYRTMKLPTTAPKEGFPVLVYGASSTVGAFAMSLLKAAGYRSIAVASAQHHAWLTEKLGAAQCVDYREAGWPDAVAAVSENAGLKYALDCIGGPAATSIDETLEKCGAGGEGQIATVDPMASLEGKSTLIKFDIGSIQTGALLEEAGKYVKMIDGLLAEGKLITMPTKEIGGLEAAVEGMEMLKAGKVRGEKLVVKV
jgi:NADPH:quinone reductase-like Zn-dependent oxidoreductase